jgi:hypothetical protein
LLNRREKWPQTISEQRFAAIIVYKTIERGRYIAKRKVNAIQLFTRIWEKVACLGKKEDKKWRKDGASDRFSACLMFNISM